MNDILNEFLEGFTLTKDQIAPGSDAIADVHWQRFRLTLKGVSTETKLYYLREWLKTHKGQENARVQVMNYINALKRGGQLSRDGKVQR